jgi:hypothetical protein
MARHGFDRPLDYRRLHWSRWFRCESHHSLLFVPSKPGVFAIAEEILPLNDAPVGADPSVGKDTFVRPGTAASASARDRVADPVSATEPRPGLSPETESRKPEAISPRRMLAVTQFFEDDDMAFVLDRMLSHQNPMRARLVSGRYFVRFVVIEDQTQRRTICNALNQWMVTAAEKATGIGSHFASSLELTPATEYVPSLTGDDLVGRTVPSPGSGQVLSANADTTDTQVVHAPGSARVTKVTAPQLDSGAATNIHCPSPFPSGF